MTDRWHFVLAAPFQIRPKRPVLDVRFLGSGEKQLQCLPPNICALSYAEERVVRKVFLAKSLRCPDIRGARRRTRRLPIIVAWWADGHDEGRAGVAKLCGTNAFGRQ